MKINEKDIYSLRHNISIHHSKHPWILYFACSSLFSVVTLPDEEQLYWAEYNHSQNAVVLATHPQCSVAATNTDSCKSVTADLNFAKGDGQPAMHGSLDRNGKPTPHCSGDSCNNSKRQQSHSSRRSSSNMLLLLWYFTFICRIFCNALLAITTNYIAFEFALTSFIYFIFVFIYFILVFFLAFHH